jgi:hypothetical protein
MLLSGIQEALVVVHKGLLVLSSKVDDLCYCGDRKVRKSPKDEASAWHSDRVATPETKFHPYLVCRAVHSNMSTEVPCTDVVIVREKKFSLNIGEVYCAICWTRTSSRNQAAQIAREIQERRKPFFENR